MVSGFAHICMLVVVASLEVSDERARSVAAIWEVEVEGR